jgi:putative ABC transport system permease protein
MKISESLRTGSLEIFHHKMRSFLTFFAISIGVISIMYSLTLIYSMNLRTRKAIEMVGPGRLTLEIKNRWQADSDMERKEAQDVLTLDDALALRAQLPGLYMVSPVIDKYADFVHGTFVDATSVAGVTMEWKKRGWVYKVRGRFINQHDLDTYARVCVIIEEGGYFKKPKWMAIYDWRDKAQNYIKHNDLLGKMVKLGENLYTVVGILQEPPLEKNPKSFMDVEGGWQAKVIIPITTSQRLMSGYSSSSGVDAINIDTGDEKTIDLYKRKIEKLIQARHGGRVRLNIKDFRELIKQQLSAQQRNMYTALILGAIAILAGGIGIMNVTLATIYSRIREIGIRRAIGATRGDIMAQFIIEAMLLGFLGGLAGIFIGLLGIQYLASKGDTEMMMLQWWMPFCAIVVAVFTGFFASLYPAYQASRLDPIEALRYE